MARFSEILSFVIIATALLTTTVSCSPTPIKTEPVNEPDTGDITAIGGEVDNAPAAPVITEGVDSNCDCEDEEAMFHKLIRKLIDTEAIKGRKDFLKQFPIKKICGSDGRLYRTDCEFQCTRMKLPEPEELQRVNRGNCKKFGKGRALKGKEDSNKVPKLPSVHHHPEGKEVKLERMQRIESEPHTLVCICPRNYFPVCASNGITYGNRCAFDCAKENIDPELTVVKLGDRCNEDDRTVI